LLISIKDAVKEPLVILIALKCLFSLLNEDRNALMATAERMNGAASLKAAILRSRFLTAVLCRSARSIP
jgi:hypothetical protein